MLNYLKFVFDATINTIKGLLVTLKTLVLPSVTVQYPTEKLMPYPKFRGMLLYDPEKCIACGLCDRACPSKCINFAVQKDAEGKNLRKIEWYSIDYGKCNFCGLCEEACPTKPKSLWHSLDYEVVFNTRQEMTRYWSRGDNFWGKSYDFDKKVFTKIQNQVHVQTTPDRK